MAIKKDWMKKLQQLDGAVLDRTSPHYNVLRSPSPSVNFVFGNGHGLPFGYSAIIAGPPKGGKSVLANQFIAQLHKDFPEAIAIKYNTELRDSAQLTPVMAKAYGIDMTRYVGYDANHPEKIFDAIRDEVAPMCEEGAPVKLIIIDSVNAVVGRRSLNAESIMSQQIGDVALTLKEGLKLILPMQRKYKIALLLTCHISIEMDPQMVRQGKTTKPAVGLGVLHHAEYLLYTSPNQSKEGRSDLLGNELVDDTKTDLMDKGDKTGHKIRVRMEASSMGPAGRTGSFTLNYHTGITATEEEVFLLGVNRGVIGHPNNTRYEYGERYWVGKEAMLTALRDDKELSESILTELRRRDLEGTQTVDENSALPDLMDILPE